MLDLAYYHCLFKEQQKDISGFLRELWKADPFQAKWAILAKVRRSCCDAVFIERTFTSTSFGLFDS